MNDDQMDELLIQGARDYNKPGAVPREEMWGAIAAARRRPATARLGDSATRRTPQRVWLWPSIGIAAAALIALGITIGRRMGGPALVPAVAVNPVVVKPKFDSRKSNEQETIVKALHEETRKTDAAVRRLAQSAQSPSRPVAQSPSNAQAPARERAPGRATESPSPDSRQLAYRLVVLRHLAGSEALITSFRASAKRGEMDAQIAQWSRELLGTTRLLEASQAADDPVMKRLLEDLDLVIAQIAQYATRGTYNPDELDLIEQSISQRGVISKLRSANAPSQTAHM